MSVEGLSSFLVRIRQKRMSLVEEYQSLLQLNKAPQSDARTRAGSVVDNKLSSYKANFLAQESLAFEKIISKNLEQKRPRLPELKVIRSNHKSNKGIGLRQCTLERKFRGVKQGTLCLSKSSQARRFMESTSPAE